MRLCRRTPDLASAAGVSSAATVRWSWLCASARTDECADERMRDAGQRRQLGLEQRGDEERVPVQLDGARLAGGVDGADAQRRLGEACLVLAVDAVAAV